MGEPGAGGGQGSECVTGTVSVCDEEKVLEVDGGDGCAQCECASCHRAGALKMIKMVHF